MFNRNCFQTVDFYTEDTASPKVISALSSPLLLATGNTHTPTRTHTTHTPSSIHSFLSVFPEEHEALSVKQFVKHVTELHQTNTFSKEFEVRETSA